MLDQAQIAKFFGDGPGGMSQKLSFVDDEGQTVEAKPTLAWFIATGYYNDLPEWEVGWVSKPSLRILGYVVVAIVHTEIGSKALLYFEEMPKNTKDTVKMSYEPHVIEIDASIDHVRHHLSAFNLISQDRTSPRKIDAVPNIMEIYTPGRGSRISFAFHDEVTDAAYLEFWDSILMTIELVAQQYGDEQLSERFKRPE